MVLVLLQLDLLLIDSDISDRDLRALTTVLANLSFLARLLLTPLVLYLAQVPLS